MLLDSISPGNTFNNDAAKNEMVKWRAQRSHVRVDYRYSTRSIRRTNLEEEGGEEKVGRYVPVGMKRRLVRTDILTYLYLRQYRYL